MKPQRTAAQRRLTAYHEAGHAVAAWRLGIRPKHLTIAPGDGYVGLAHCANPLGKMSPDISPEWIHPDSIEGARMMRGIERAIIITLAGPLAQRR